MSKVFIEESTLTAIGDAIRGKTGKTELLNPTNMPAEISSIQSGSGIPAEGFILTGSCSDRFANNGWNWFIDMYGDIIKTQDITNSSYMFSHSNELQSIPFDINFEQSNNTGNKMDYTFDFCNKLLELPKMNYARPTDIAYLFENCQKIRYIPDNFDSTWDWSYIDTATSNGTGSMKTVFNLCYSLRKLPINMMKHGNKYASQNIS